MTDPATISAMNREEQADSWLQRATRKAAHRDPRSQRVVRDGPARPCRELRRLLALVCGVIVRKPYAYERGSQLFDRCLR